MLAQLDVPLSNPHHQEAKEEGTNPSQPEFLTILLFALHRFLGPERAWFALTEGIYSPLCSFPSQQQPQQGLGENQGKVHNLRLILRETTSWTSSRVM